MAKGHMQRSRQTAVIIGAGPAGLTAALEFCRQSSIRPIILESTNRIGGISCTIRYNGNNQDHSMLTAMLAVENILAGITGKQNLWEVNTEQEYHEQKSSAPAATNAVPVPAPAARKADGELAA